MKYTHLKCDDIQVSVYLSMKCLYPLTFVCAYINTYACMYECKYVVDTSIMNIYQCFLYLR